MFFLAFKHMKEIVRTHSTISSYCADPISNTHANRGLLAATCLFGGCLCALLVEEYNSRSDSDYRFYFELAAAAMLPLVGICPTGGAGAQQIKYWIVIKGCCKVPIEFSTAIHCFAALYFMIANTILNMSYAAYLFYKDTFVKKIPHSAATWVVYIFSIGSCFVLGGFLFTQAGIFVKAYLKKMRIASGLKFTDSTPLVSGQTDSSASFQGLAPSPSINSEDYKCEVCGCTHRKELCSDCGTITDKDADAAYFTHWRWYFASFMFEMFVVFFVLITTALCSIKRNNMFHYFD